MVLNFEECKEFMMKSQEMSEDVIDVLVSNKMVKFKQSISKIAALKLLAKELNIDLPNRDSFYSDNAKYNICLTDFELKYLMKLLRRTHKDFDEKTSLELKQKIKRQTDVKLNEDLLDDPEFQPKKPKKKSKKFVDML